MSSFTSPLDVRHLDGRRWEVLQPFTYYLDEEEGVIMVPKGFVTDFASIPRLFWSIIGHPTGRYGKAAVIHDYTYYTAMYVKWKCDLIFLQAMKVLKVWAFKRWLMYQAVRRFGWIGWNAHRRREGVK